MPEVTEGVYFIAGKMRLFRIPMFNVLGEPLPRTSPLLMLACLERPTTRSSPFRKWEFSLRTLNGSSSPTPTSIILGVFLKS